MSPRKQCIQIYQFIKIASLATIGKNNNISKSSVYRRLQVITSRSHHPCASIFETEEGYAWIELVVIVCVFIFGIKSNAGAATISLFLSIIGLDLFVGTSSSSIEKIENKIDALLKQYENERNKELPELAKNIKIHAGADETFFKLLQILIFMDLPTGFIFKEEITTDRKFTTWEKLALPFAKLFKEFNCLISDGARAIGGLAKNTLNCINIMDLFHIQQNIVKLVNFQLTNKLIAVNKKINTAVGNIKTDQTLNNEVKIKELVTELTTLNIEKEKLENSNKSYKKELFNISAAVHPFSIDTSTPQASKDVYEKLNNSLTALQKIITDCDIVDNKNRLAKMGRQIPKASQQIDAWWQSVIASLSYYNFSYEKKQWLMDIFLPTVYWQQQLDKARKPRLKNAYKKALELSLDKYNRSIIGNEDLLQNLDEWNRWAMVMSSQFQRTSSAVEGRNGLLSLAFHFCRGISETRLNSLTVIHNYFITRRDGTTAYNRLFNKESPPLLEYIIKNIGELPEPRYRKINNNLCCNNHC